MAASHVVAATDSTFRGKAIVPHALQHHRAPIVLSQSFSCFERVANPTYRCIIARSFRSTRCLNHCFDQPRSRRLHSGGEKICELLGCLCSRSFDAHTLSELDPI